MNGQRQNSSPSGPRPVPGSNDASRGGPPPSESTPREASTARLASPIPSSSAQGTPPIRQVPTPAQLHSGSHTPLAGAGAEGSHSIPDPGQSALAAALQSTFGRSPPRFGTPPVRPLSPGTAGAALQGSGPQTTYGSFESRSGQVLGRRVSGAPGEDPKIVKRHLVQPSNLDGAIDNGESTSVISKKSSKANFPSSQCDSLATGIGDDEFSSLRLQGGDVTREMYRWAHDAESPTQGGRAKRSKSWHISYAELENETPEASAINVPGGFRREYLRRQAPSPSSEHDEMNIRAGSRQRAARRRRTPKVHTSNFYEFLTIHGHFAGEDLAEEDENEYDDADPYDEEDYEQGDIEGEDGDPGEGSALLRPSTAGPPRRKPKNNNTPTGAALLLLKSFVGTGVLFLPRAYLNGGMMFSNCVLLFVAGLSYYCFILLVNTRLKIEGSFGDMGGILYGKWMRALILGSVVLSQIGFVAAYIVFTSENMQAFVLAVSKCRSFIDIKGMVFMQLIIFLPLSLIRDIGKLGFTAFIADVFIFLGLIYLAYFDISTLKAKGTADIVNLNPRDWTLFIGTAIFTFEGVGLIIPIQESMRNPSNFPPVLAGVMIAITVLFIGIGALSYAAFGSATKTVVLLNLPQDNHFVNTVQLFYSLAILLSTPLQLFPAIRIMETELFSLSGKHNVWIKWKKNGFRCLLVVLCAFTAWVGAGDLDKFVALVGSFACVPLIYVYPVRLNLMSYNLSY